MKHTIKIYYDKDCPFCRNYAQFVKLKDKHDLAVFNARDNLEKMKFLKLKGFDINDGIIIEVDDKTIYQGFDALEFLDTLSLKHIFLVNTKLFKYILYPLIKFTRKIVLYILSINPNIKF